MTYQHANTHAYRHQCIHITPSMAATHIHLHCTCVLLYVRCTAYNTRTLYDVRCTTYTLYTVRCTAYTLYTVHCTLYGVYTVHCMMYGVYTVHCTIYGMYHTYTYIVRVSYAVHHKMYVYYTCIVYRT